MRFPWKAFPRSRRRSPSLFHVVYLGTHPVALMMSMFISMMVLALAAEWLMLVVMAWACWTAVVTAGWLWRVASAELKR